MPRGRPLGDTVMPESQEIRLRLPNAGRLSASVTTSGGAQKTSIPDEVDFSDVVALVEGVAQAFGAVVAGIVGPGTTIRFSLDFGIENGTVIGKLVDGDANGMLRVALTWGDLPAAEIDGDGSERAP